MLHDLQFALRQLIKYPAFTAVAAVTLALGIGVNTTMFSVMNAIVLQASASPDSSRLVCLFGTSPQLKDRTLSPGDFYDIRRQNTSFSHLAAYQWNNFNLAEPGQPAQRLAGMNVSGDFFTVFGIPPELGRSVSPDQDEAGSGQVAVLSDGFWRSHFAADPGVIGRAVRMDGVQVTIIGVMPSDFQNLMYWGHVDLWRPFAYDAATRASRANGWFQSIGRLAPGVSLAQARSDMGTIASRLARDFPQTDEGNGLRLATWDSVKTSDVSRKICSLCLGLSGFVLLIACANLANLQLARMAQRVREHAVRIALGASRMQLVRQLVVENLLLAAVGGAIGVLIASWGAKLIGGSIYIAGIRGFDIPINGRVLAYTLVASAVTGVVVGLIPALIASRTDVNAALKQGARGSTGDRSRHLFRKVLIVGELALALILMAGAGYFVRGMQRMANAELGWTPDGLVTAGLSLPYNASYTTDAQCRAFLDKLDAKLAGLPGVQTASMSSYLPVVGIWRNEGVIVEGRPVPNRGQEPLTGFNSVSPGFFSTIGMRVVKGRGFTSADRAGSAPVAVINESMAEGLWPGESPIGKRYGGLDPAHRNWTEVVGVVNDVKSTIELVRAPETRYASYTPLAQASNTHWIDLAIRSTAPESTVAFALRAAVQQIDPDEPVYEIVSARESMAQITGSFTMVSDMLMVFAFIGLILSAVGIYGVVSNLVAQRTSEIGIRMALGAQTGDVLWLVFGQGLRLAVTGTAIGLACAFGLVRLLNAGLPAIPGSDPFAVLCVSAVMAASALFACWLPARRATRVNPIIALRSE
ncbi:MAG TPA: ABC transporter permease [Opitutaceae bacterium]